MTPGPWWPLVAAIAVMALVFGFLGLVLPAGSKDSSGSGIATPAPPTAAGSNAAANAVIDVNATPGADWKPFDPNLQPAPGGIEHAVTLAATEIVREVAPGVTQEVWTFNDQVPGPTLRGKVGDVFTITLRNDGKMSHSIDFHASEVAWSDEMRSISPGESLVYQFKADHSGIFMYHCGTAPALHHIGNGMFGAIIIDPPDLAPVDHELVFVQSELYLGPEGQPGDLVKMLDEDDDAVVFNGCCSPAPGSQALGLQPAQGGFVEFSLAEPGLYLIVTHKFANVGKGALGMFQAGDVDAAASSGGH